ncbi:hypothetical protein [Pseudonocardia sp. N23]|uniref:hypothetical protein n=1 Tax=Pseudonocardia sp. N23 TaxID=1987376 RepID=UPI001C0EACB5|nr:hypothetical protein [Pseudonocardia sp. N23]
MVAVGVVLGPHPGQPAAGQPDDDAEHDGRGQQTPLGRAVGPREATDGQADDAVDEGKLETSRTDDLVALGLAVDGVSDHRNQEPDLDG